MSDTPAFSFNPDDYVLEITVEDFEDLKHFLKLVRVVVELRSAREERLKEKAEKEARRKAKEAQGFKVDEYDEDWYEEASIPGIAYITGAKVTRDRCHGAFFRICHAYSLELTQCATHLFDNNGRLKQEYTKVDWHKGSGCFGTELNDGPVIYLDTVRVDKQVRQLSPKLHRPDNSINCR